MSKSTLKPSHFATQHPWASVLVKRQYEGIALNIMKILKRKGNTFRPLSWEDYKSERINDIKLQWEEEGFADLSFDFDFLLREEQIYFKEVAPYCESGDTAALFSPAWKEIADSIGTE